MGVTGLEQPAENTGNTAIAGERAAKCAAPPPSAADDPDLARLIAAWPALEPAVQMAIMAMVDG